MTVFIAGSQHESLEILKFRLVCIRMITTAQIRAGRGLLKWTQSTLAHRASISAATLNMIENETVHPRETTLTAIRHALERAGVYMLEENGIGVGVRFAPERVISAKDVSKPIPTPSAHSTSPR